jgi:hypothetical protein
MHFVDLRRGEDYKILRRGAIFYGVWGWSRVLGDVKHAFCYCGKQRILPSRVDFFLVYFVDFGRRGYKILRTVAGFMVFGIECENSRFVSLQANVLACDDLFGFFVVYP